MSGRSMRTAKRVQREAKIALFGAHILTLCRQNVQNMDVNVLKLVLRDSATTQDRFGNLPVA